MNKITSFIASVGESVAFVTAMAHFWFAWAFVASFNVHTLTRVYIVIGIAAVAAIKEFYFDLKYEQSPPQTLDDSLTDYTEYVSGALVALVFKWLV